MATSSCKVFSMAQLKAGKAVRRLLQNRKLHHQHFLAVRSLWLWKWIAGCGRLWKGSLGHRGEKERKKKKKSNGAATETTQKGLHTGGTTWNWDKVGRQGTWADSIVGTNRDGLSSLPGFRARTREAGELPGPRGTLHTHHRASTTEAFQEYGATSAHINPFILLPHKCFQC